MLQTYGQGLQIRGSNKIFMINFSLPHFDRERLFLCNIKKWNAMEKGTKDNPHTILSSMEDIVVKAKEHGLDDIFYSEAENSMKRLSGALLMSKEETLVLSLFFERKLMPARVISAKLISPFLRSIA